jgi:V/A-type H+/Na+-transporting ATPase subunit D
MATKVRLTKNELKVQKDSLKRFRRYLPTLQLKKQLLQVEIRKVEVAKEEKRKLQQELRNDIAKWVAVFGDGIDLGPYLKVSKILTGTGNIAGVTIPVFQGLEFENLPWDVLTLPPWVDKGIDAFKRILTFDVEVAVLEEQARLLGDELRTTTQRVNLFEKVKIPEARTNIRTINIYLGDQRTAAVVRGKISKASLVRGAS